MFGKPVAVPIKVHVLLHDIGSVIPAVFMLMGVSPNCSRYELFVWRTVYFPTIYVQRGHFDALMTIDLGSICWAVVCWLQLSSLIANLVRAITH